MELRLLRSFLTVAREQSISGAAHVLHLSQPSLSRQIMDLEEARWPPWTRYGRKIFGINRSSARTRRWKADNCEAG